MRVIELIEGHYEAQEVEFGRVYRWTPETVVIACDCRERLLLTSSATTCKGCGADHTATFRDEGVLRQPEDRTLHPWRYARDRVGSGIPY